MTLGVDDRLHMLGALSANDIADLYAAADVFVFPSIWETFGLAAVEAGMAGMPMVVADLPVLHEVLRADGCEPVAFVTPRRPRRMDFGNRPGVGGGACIARRHRVRPRVDRQIFAAAHDRELSQSV